MEFLFICFLGMGFMLFLIVIGNIRLINEYERGVLFTLGRFTRIMDPGLHITLPFVHRMVKVDIRTKTVDLAEQEAITKDNVSAKISAVLYYRIDDAARSIIEVEHSAWATSQLAETTMRTVVGEFTLDEMLTHRVEVAKKIEGIVEKTSAAWGVQIQSVELKDVKLPESMTRTMAKQAEAEREKRATIINSEGEVVAAENLAKAAKTMAETPGALHLRTLNSINDISSDQSNTIVFGIPMEILKAIQGFSKSREGNN